MHALKYPMPKCSVRLDKCARLRPGVCCYGLKSVAALNMVCVATRLCLPPLLSSPQVPSDEQAASVTEMLRERSKLPDHVLKVYLPYMGCCQPDQAAKHQQKKLIVGLCVKEASGCASCW
jgi:hypothetical protein